MSLPDYSQLEGLTWNQLQAQHPDVLLQLLEAFGRQQTSMESVDVFTNEVRDWLAGAYLNVTAYKNDIEAINQNRFIQVKYRQTTGGLFVVPADLLTDPENYSIFYPVLHNVPFVHLSVSDFPVINFVPSTPPVSP